MCPHRANRITMPTQRVAFALAAAVLFLMPMSYRGGAEAAHPHALLQLWVEAAHSLPDHHHAYLRHASPASSEQAGSARVSPDIPRSQQSAVTVGIAPIPILTPASGAASSIRRRVMRSAADDPPLAGVRHRPESPPPKAVA